MQYLFAIEKRQFAKPKINMVCIKDREKNPFLHAVFCSLPSLTLRNFYPHFILNGNIKYLLTITKSFCFIYWKINATKFIFPKQTCSVEIEFFFSMWKFSWELFFYFIKSHSHTHFSCTGWKALNEGAKNKEKSWTETNSTRFGCSTDVLKILSDNYIFCAASCFQPKFASYFIITNSFLINIHYLICEGRAKLANGKIWACRWGKRGGKMWKTFGFMTIRNCAACSKSIKVN